MADNSLQAKPTFGNPEAIWQNACNTLELAKKDIANFNASESRTEAEWDFYADLECYAVATLLKTPAPNGEALARKLEIFTEYDCGELIDELQKPIFAAMIADARKLGGLA